MNKTSLTPACQTVLEVINANDKIDSNQIIEAVKGSFPSSRPGELYSVENIFHAISELLRLGFIKQN